MTEEAWHEARLIPTSGISGADEQERRATSALLAVLTAVREFGRGLTQPLGAPAGAVETFIEVQSRCATGVGGMALSRHDCSHDLGKQLVRHPAGEYREKRYSGGVRPRPPDRGRWRLHC